MLSYLHGDRDLQRGLGGDYEFITLIHKRNEGRRDEGMNGWRSGGMAVGAHGRGVFFQMGF